MTARQELLEARTQLRAAIVAAEEWQESYKLDPETFALLTTLEAQLETNVAEYLHELAPRAVVAIDWSLMPTPLLADASPVPNGSDPFWADEQRLLTIVTMAIITDLVATGALAGERIYGLPIGFGTLPVARLDVAIQEAARKHTAEFVRNVTDTTRKQIRESVARSIALGEDANAATLRLMQVIDNPVRAELISQTEPVNAYQTGLKHYAKSTGAVSKEWDGLAGACRLCAPQIGKTTGIDEGFVLADGRVIDRPAAHPRCRCGIIYNY